MSQQVGTTVQVQKSQGGGVLKGLGTLGLNMAGAELGVPGLGSAVLGGGGGASGSGGGSSAVTSKTLSDNRQTGTPSLGGLGDYFKSLQPTDTSKSVHNATQGAFDATDALTPSMISPEYGQQGQNDNSPLTEEEIRYRDKLLSLHPELADTLSNPKYVRSFMQVGIQGGATASDPYEF